MIRKIFCCLFLAILALSLSQLAYASSNCSLLYSTMMRNVDQGVRDCVTAGGTYADCHSSPDAIQGAADAAEAWAQCQSMKQSDGMPVFPSDPNFTCYWSFDPSTGNVEFIVCYAAELKLPKLKLGIPWLDKDEPTVARFEPSPSQTGHDDKVVASLTEGRTAGSVRTWLDRLSGLTLAARLKHAS